MNVQRALAGFLSLSLAACDFEFPLFRKEQAVPAAKPIPKNAASRWDRKDDVAARVAWAHRQALGAYDRVGLRNAKWDTAARKFISDSIPSLMGTPGAPDAEAHAAAGRALLELGCNDPLVLYLVGAAIFDTTFDSAEPEHFYARAVEGMKTVPYPRAIAFVTALALHGRYDWRNEGIGLRKPLGALELRWFQESLHDGSYGPGDSLVLLDFLDSGGGPNFFDRTSAGAAAALGQAAWVERWIQLRYSGRRHHNAAWDARGRGWARDVPQEAWAKFHALNEQARTDLAEAWRLRPDRPEAAFDMMSNAQDNPVPGENARLWFDRTVAAQVDYLGAYEDMLRQLLPRWGGSYQEMLAFGREAADTARFDTQVPFIALRAARRILDDQRDEKGGAGGTPIYRWPVTYPLVSRVLDGYLKARPDRAGYYHSMWAIAADRAGKPEEALLHLKAAGFRMGVAADSLVDETAEVFVDRILLSTGPAAQDAGAGRARREAGDVAGALGAYQAALAKADSPQARAAVRHEVLALQHEQALNAGGWVRLATPTDGLAGWRPLLGTWRAEGDGAVIGTAGARGLLLVSDARVGPHFEMKGRVELVSSSNGMFQAAFVFGHPHVQKDKWFSFRVKRNAREGSVAYFSRHFYLPDAAPPAMSVPDVNDVHVRVDPRGMTAWVNGRVVQESYVPKGEWDQRDTTSLVGLGAYGDQNLLTLRFRDLQVRRLKQE